MSKMKDIIIKLEDDEKLTPAEINVICSSKNVEPIEYINGVFRYAAQQDKRAEPMNYINIKQRIQSKIMEVAESTEYETYIGGSYARSLYDESFGFNDVDVFFTGVDPELKDLTKILGYFTNVKTRSDKYPFTDFCVYSVESEGIKYDLIFNKRSVTELMNLRIASTLSHFFYLANTHVGGFKLIDKETTEFAIRLLERRQCIWNPHSNSGRNSGHFDKITALCEEHGIQLLIPKE